MVGVFLLGPRGCLTEFDFALVEAENRPKSAHRYNVAEQQQIYKSEIERIWKAQFDALSRREPAQLTAEDEKRYAEKKLEGGMYHLWRNLLLVDS